MKGRRVVVVGASSGIGRAVAVKAVAAGADVVLAARRAEALEEAVAEAGGGAAVAADVCVVADRERLVAEVIERLGRIDLLVSTVGQATLEPLADSDADAWFHTMDVNVIGLNQLLRLAMPQMADGGIVAALSSETAAVPRTGLVPYAAAKAALEASLLGWRVECPGVRLCCVTVGATAPTGFGDDFDHDQLGPAFDSWARHGLLQEEIMPTDDVASVMVTTLQCALDHPHVGLEHLVLRSPTPVRGPREARR